MIKIEINNPDKYPISGGLIVKVVKISAKLDKKIKGIIEINLVDNNVIKKINRNWRNQNLITDVLSFAWQEDKELISDYLGQIFISFPRIVAQAKEYKITAKEEFIRMLAHGLLHLVGYEHKKMKDAKKMFFIQEKILSRLLKK